jgi:GTP diphosphokinase / guanosine-3',5'-bis(diphosphate) 3'-diphosphatase
MEENSELNALLDKTRAYRPSSFEESKIREAFFFARDAHTDQWRKTGEPYFSHVYNTALYLTDLHADEDTICAALLHDAVEDTKITLTDIRSRFGETVAKLVQGVTKVSKVRYRDRMEDRQIVSLRKMFVSMADDLRVIIIKLADRLHNMRTLSGVRPDKQLRIAKETLEIYCPLANLLGIWHLRWQLEDLCFQYLNSTEYQKIDRFFGEYKQGSEIYIEKLKKLIEENLKEQKIDCVTEGRAKHYYSIYQKLEKQKRKPEDVYDIFALRIIVKDPDECYRALGIIHSLWKPRFNRFKDYIAVPKSNGYQSIHTTVFGPQGKNVEIQIRTTKMHEEAEFGVASHWFYKQDISPHRLKKTDWIVQLLNLQRAQKDNVNFVKNLKVDILKDRIFLFTPKGEIVDLPQGATVLDFAYAIHSDIGNHFKKAYVNGVESPKNTVLETGDTIEIETAVENTPDLSWIKQTKTSRAMETIRSFIRKETRENKEHIGKKMIKKTLERIGKDDLQKFLHHKNYNPTMALYDLKNTEDLYKAICEETVDPADFIEKVYTKEKLFPGNFLVKRDENVLNKEAQLISVEICGRDRIGVLGDIAGTISKEGVNISSFKVLALYDTSRFYYLAKLEIPSFEVLENLFEKLEQVESVDTVRRIARPLNNLIVKASIPLMLLITHIILLNYLQSNVTLFFLSFLAPAYAAWAFSKFADNQTGFFLSKMESFALSTTIAFVGFSFCYWELYFYDIPNYNFEFPYLLVLMTPYLVLKAGFYLFQVLGRKGRSGFVMVNKLREKALIDKKILHTDPKGSSYKGVVVAYEKYLLNTYQKNYQQFNCWRDHYKKIHDQINMLIGENDNLADKVIALIGCGPEPANRDFSPKLINLLRTGKLKKVVLIDFSRNILVSAIDNLIKKGVDSSHISAYQMDLTRGLSTHFCNKMGEARKTRDIKKTVAYMNDSLASIINLHPGKEVFAINEEDRFDFFISSMFATATLVPMINTCIMKVQANEDLTPDQKGWISDQCDRFHQDYNTLIVERTTNDIIGLGKNEQRGVIIADTEKIHKGVKKIRKTVSEPMINTCKKNPAVKDVQLYHWLWQDESDHYHAIQSMVMDIKKDN